MAGRRVELGQGEGSGVLRSNSCDGPSLVRRSHLPDASNGSFAAGRDHEGVLGEILAARVGEVLGAGVELGAQLLDAGDRRLGRPAAPRRTDGLDDAVDLQTATALKTAASRALTAWTITGGRRARPRPRPSTVCSQAAPAAAVGGGEAVAVGPWANDAAQGAALRNAAAGVSAASAPRDAGALGLLPPPVARVRISAACSGRRVARLPPSPRCSPAPLQHHAHADDVVEPVARRRRLLRRTLGLARRARLGLSFAGSPTFQQRIPGTGRTRAAGSNPASPTGRPRPARACRG